MNHSLSFKILAVVLGVSSVVTALSTGVQLAWEYSKSYDELKGNFNIVQQSHVESIATALWDFNSIQIEEQLRGVNHLPGILYVEVRNESGVLFSKGVRREENCLKQEFPLQKNQETLGALVVYADLNRVTDQVMQKALFIFMSQLIKTLIVSFVLYFAFQRILTRNLIGLARDLKSTDPRVLEMKYALRGKRGARDELDDLVDSINAMKDGLQRSMREVNELNQSLEMKVREKTNTILLQRQQLEYSSKMSALGHMAGGMAHEINTPLSALMVSAEQIERMADNEKKDLDRQSLKKISALAVQSVQRISTVIRALRFFSRTADRDEFRTNDLKVILTDTLELVRAPMKQKSIELIIETLPEDATLECNGVQVSQILLSLLQNAIDAVEHRPQKWIRIALQERPEHLEIRIFDSGPGVPAHLHERIMEPFFTTKDVGKGTGLGLSVAKGFIDDHGGSIVLDNLTENTCFVIQLPRKHLSSMKTA